MYIINNELYHYGVMGMKWGVRRYQAYGEGGYNPKQKGKFQPYPANHPGNANSTVPKSYAKKQQKLAKKDAKEYARAKMFYGTGAGNRRKLINATVNERSKDDIYKAWFDEYSKNQDMSEHARKATAERHSKDAREKAWKTTKQVLRIAAGTASTAAAVYVLAHNAGLTDKIAPYAKDLMSNILKHSDEEIFELYHHGVMGMKWGVRRYQSYGEKPRKSGKGGKEIGEATKRKAEQDYNEHMAKATEETQRDFEEFLELNKDWLIAVGTDSKTLMKAKIAGLKEHPDYIKAQEIVEEYNMEEWSDAVKLVKEWESKYV